MCKFAVPTKVYSSMILRTCSPPVVSPAGVVRAAHGALAGGDAGAVGRRAARRRRPHARARARHHQGAYMSIQGTLTL